MGLVMGIGLDCALLRKGSLGGRSISVPTMTLDLHDSGAEEGAWRERVDRAPKQTEQPSDVVFPGPLEHTEGD